jgi:hypothetical protein
MPSVQGAEVGGGDIDFLCRCAVGDMALARASFWFLSRAVMVHLPCLTPSIVTMFNTLLIYH